MPKMSKIRGQYDENVHVHETSDEKSRQIFIFHGAASKFFNNFSTMNLEIAIII